MSARPLRVAFFGSPAFALPSLDALAHRHDVVLVVTQPDKPAGRGLAHRAQPVALRAHELGLPLEQPRAVRGEAFLTRLASVQPDVGVTAAYGRILPPALLEIPRHGVLNVHASLLPMYRGAAPVQWALINDEQETGITVMQTEAGLDTGPVRLQRRTAIEQGEDSVALMARLAVLGAETLVEALDLLVAGTLPSTPQDDAAATLAPLLTSDDGRIRWADGPASVLARHRGVAAWPGSWFDHGGVRVKALDLEEAALPRGGQVAVKAAPGTVTEVGPDGVAVAAGSGSVLLKRVKPAGSRAMGAHEWSLGRGPKVGDRLG